MSNEFENQVMLKLGKLEAGLDDLKKQLLDNGQPGFITETRKRLTHLEAVDYRRSLIERGISACVAILVSAATAVGVHRLIK
jgi:hypothetical protein